MGGPSHLLIGCQIFTGIQQWLAGRCGILIAKFHPVESGTTGHTTNVYGEFLDHIHLWTEKFDNGMTCKYNVKDSIDWASAQLGDSNSSERDQVEVIREMFLWIVCLLQTLLPQCQQPRQRLTGIKLWPSTLHNCYVAVPASFYKALYSQSAMLEHTNMMGQVNIKAYDNEVAGKDFLARGGSPYGINNSHKFMRLMALEREVFDICKSVVPDSFYNVLCQQFRPAKEADVPLPEGMK